MTMKYPYSLFYKSLFLPYFVLSLQNSDCDYTLLKMSWKKDLTFSIYYGSFPRTHNKEHSHTFNLYGRKQSLLCWTNLTRLALEKMLSVWVISCRTPPTVTYLPLFIYYKTMFWMIFCENESVSINPNWCRNDEIRGGRKLHPPTSWSIVKRTENLTTKVQKDYIFASFHHSNQQKNFKNFSCIDDDTYLIISRPAFSFLEVLLLFSPSVLTREKFPKMTWEVHFTLYRHSFRSWSGQTVPHTL